jgi:DNA repair protein RecO (recombination protein O)
MSRSRVYATEAIVLRRADFGEADRLLTILTPKMGKLRVMAKGARKITSRKAGHVELFTRVKLLIAQGRTFDIVSQAETIEPHRPLREELQRGMLAHYFAEMAEQFAQEDNEDVPLYETLAEGLMWLSECVHLPLAARAFEMRLLTLAGYRPQVFKCADTGAALETDLKPDDTKITTLFSPAHGGALCAAAASRAREGMMLTRDALTLLRILQLQTFEEIDKLDAPETTQTQVERALQRQLAFVMERGLRSAPLVRQMQADK